MGKPQYVIWMPRVHQWAKDARFELLTFDTWREARTWIEEEVPNEECTLIPIEKVAEVLSALSRIL